MLIPYKSNTDFGIQVSFTTNKRDPYYYYPHYGRVIERSGKTIGKTPATKDAVRISWLEVLILVNKTKKQVRQEIKTYLEWL